MAAYKINGICTVYLVAIEETKKKTCGLFFVTRDHTAFWFLLEKDHANYA